MKHRRALGSIGVAAWLLMPGCNEILGIQDLKDRLPDAAATPESGTATRGTRAADAARQAAGADAATQPSDAAPPARDAQLRDALPPSAAADAAGVTEIRAVLVDALRQPVAGAEVLVDGQRAQTDAMGRSA